MTPIKQWGVRARVMLVAIVPAIVLALAMITYYTQARLDDLARAYADRGRALAHQIATATEYAVFSGNREDLQRLLTSAFAEDGIRGILVTNASGTPMASSGRLDPPPHVIPSAGDGQRTFSGTIRFHAPIVPVRLNIDGLPGSAPAEPSANVLGTVVLDISTTRLDAQRNELIWTGAAVLALVLAGSIALATRMSQGVSRPIRNVARTVYRIGAGQLHERVDVAGGGSLKRLAIGVNEMAERLQFVRDEMAREIADATAELRARKDAAENADLAKSRFLAAASHDLRQPMHALGLFIAELSSHTHPPTTERLVRQIAASAESMENLLDALLDISRLDAGALEPNIRPSPLQPIFDRIANDFQLLAEEQGLTLHVRPCAAWIVTDPLLFERILSNLVSNAIRYTDTGRIMLAARRSGDQLRIEVRDSGKGIAPDAQEVIFQEFVQLDNPERARAKGLGLGLAIVRRLTQLLGHTLSLRSQPEAGAVFGITAATCAPVAVPDAPPLERAPGSLHGVRVALIDDDPPALESLTTLLRSWGCEVRAATSLEALLATLQAGPPPDVLISDYCLPGHDSGLDVVTEVQLICGYRLRSILISGDTTRDALALARSAGLPLLHKPVRPAKLRALMQRMLAASTEDTDEHAEG